MSEADEVAGGRTDADEPALSIGVVVGGLRPETLVWSDAAMALARRVKELRAGVESRLGVNVVFQVPGEVLGVHFTGVRTGRYSSRRRLLLVQAAVPDEPSDDVESVLLELLKAAVDEAERFAVRRGLTVGTLPELRALVDGIALPRAEG